MENLYYLVMRMSTWTQNDPHQFLHHYFVENGAFVTSFAIALAVAFIGLLVFYGWFGMVSNRLSNRTIWVVVLLVVGLVTFALTQLIVIGSMDNLTGFFNDAATFASELKKNVPLDKLSDFTQQVDQIKNAISDGCDVTWALDLWNTAISLIVFFVGSLLAKRFTRYAIAIPF